MRRFYYLALIVALVAPVGAESMEAFDSVLAKTALGILPSSGVHPSLALLGAALCGVFALQRSSRA